MYLVEALRVRRVKIGVAIDPYRRLLALCGASPVKLRLVGTIRGDIGTERALHERFAAERVHHEWFRDCPVIRAHFAAQESWEAYRRPKPNASLSPPAPPPRVASPTNDNWLYRSIANKYLPR